jgi:hypothetical protein
MKNKRKMLTKIIVLGTFIMSLNFIPSIVESRDKRWIGKTSNRGHFTSSHRRYYRGRMNVSRNYRIVFKHYKRYWDAGNETGNGYQGKSYYMGKFRAIRR